MKKFRVMFKDGRSVAVSADKYALSQMISGTVVFLRVGERGNEDVALVGITELLGIFDENSVEDVTPTDLAGQLRGKN